MLFIASQIVLCIVLAAIIGFVAGWLIRGVRRARTTSDIVRAWEARLAERDRKIEALRLAYASSRASTQPDDGSVRDPAPPESGAGDRELVKGAPAIQADATETDLSGAKVDLQQMQAALQQLVGSHARLEELVSGLSDQVRADKVEPHPNAQTGTRLAYAGDDQSPRDDLKRILGIGPSLERTLNDLGVCTYRQIASWTEDEIKAISARLGSFGTRIKRDNWVQSAKEQHRLKYGHPL